MWSWLRRLRLLWRWWLLLLYLCGILLLSWLLWRGEPEPYLGPVVEPEPIPPVEQPVEVPPRPLRSPARPLQILPRVVILENPPTPLQEPLTAPQVQDDAGVEPESPRRRRR